LFFAKQSGAGFGNWQRRWQENDDPLLQRSRLAQVFGSVSSPAVNAPVWVIKNRVGEAQQVGVGQLTFLATACRCGQVGRGLCPGALVLAEDLRVERRAGWPGFAERGARWLGNGRFGVAEVLVEERPFLHPLCLARLPQTLSVKRFGSGSGSAICGAGWLAKALQIARKPIGKVRLVWQKWWKGNGRFPL
jgi:hypothetical protein